MDTERTLGELKARVRQFAEARDWEQFHAPKNLSMAIAAEAAELMEHFLWQSPEQSRADIDDPAKRRVIEAELADILIFALAFANCGGIDIDSAIDAKMYLNEARYPVDQAFGKSDKYTEEQ